MFRHRPFQYCDLILAPRLGSSALARSTTSHPDTWRQQSRIEKMAAKLVLHSLQKVADSHRPYKPYPTLRNITTPIVQAEISAWSVSVCMSGLPCPIALVSHNHLVLIELGRNLAGLNAITHHSDPTIMTY